MYASQFGWGHTDVEKLGAQKQVDPKVEAERKKLEDERFKLEENAYKEAYGHVAARSQKLLLTEIARQAGSIEDEYKRTNAVRDIFEKINEVLTADTRHIKLMNSLWAKSRKSGFSPESRNRLVSTLLARAKQVMPAISRDIMAQINKKKDEKKIVKKSDAGGKVEAKAPAQNAPIPAPKGKVDWSKYKNSTDFLNAFVENKGKVART
jgi:hypothetical protein